MSDQNTAGWESSDQDINRYFKQMADPEGEVPETQGDANPIPYRFVRLEKKSDKSKWTQTVDQTVYRFYGDIRTVTSDKGYTELVTDGVTLRRQLMLALWNDLGELSGDKLPWYLRDIPVSGFGPLSKASGYLRGGKVDKYMVDPDKGPKWHVKAGVKPLKMYWAAVHVTRYIDDEVMAGPAILLLKEWQAREISSVIDVMREMNGQEWDVTGRPFHILNMPSRNPQDVSLKVTPAGSRRVEDKEVFDMSKYEKVDFRVQGDALVSTLDEYLVEENCQIKDFPHPGAHATDGWSSVKPLATLQYEDVLAGKDEEQEAAFSDRSLDELKALAVEQGLTVPKKATRASLIKAINSSVPF